MAIRIFISPSDQTGNQYAGQDTSEGVQMGLLGSLVQTRLDKAGFRTLLVHQRSMADKVQSSKNFGADLYVCLHSNAANKKASGTHIFYWSKESAGYRCGLKIFEQLAPYCPGTDDRMIQDQTLYEIRYPDAPTVYIEVDFHDVAEIAAWMVDHLPEIADKIVAGICNYYNVTVPGRKWSVCLGEYSSEAAAIAASKIVKVREIT